MSLDMGGHIDDTFESMVGTRISAVGGGYVNGIWQDGYDSETPHSVNLQPASLKQIDALNQGGERVVDVRNVYINDGIVASINEADQWTFDGVNGRFKCHQVDNRPWRNYCKCVVSRIDE